MTHPKDEIREALEFSKARLKNLSALSPSDKDWTHDNKYSLPRIDKALTLLDDCIIIKKADVPRGLEGIIGKKDNLTGVIRHPKRVEMDQENLNILYKAAQLIAQED
jgi:hypothetical protein